MKLTELEPQYIKFDRRITDWERIIGDHETWRERGCPTETVSGPKDFHIYVNTLTEAQGIQFLCPACFKSNGGRVGTHSIICWFRDKGVPDDADPKPGRWTPQGLGYDDLTFVPGNPPMAVSVLLTGGCNWHGFINNGEVQ